MYLTFGDYLSLGGTLSEAEFTRLYTMAAAIVDFQTFGRLKKAAPLFPNLKYLMYEMIFRLGLKENGIVSASNDGVSVTIDKDRLQNEIEELPTIFLCGEEIDGVPLFYRGADSPLKCDFSDL